MWSLLPRRFPLPLHTHAQRKREKKSNDFFFLFSRVERERERSLNSLLVSFTLQLLVHPISTSPLNTNPQRGSRQTVCVLSRDFALFMRDILAGPLCFTSSSSQVLNLSALPIFREKKKRHFLLLLLCFIRSLVVKRSCIPVD